MKSRLVAAAAIGVTLAWGTSVEAREIKVEGCVGIYQACLVVWSHGHPYNITWSFPRPVPGTYVLAKGHDAGPAVICKGATNLIPAFALAKPGYCSKGKRTGY